jgi:hypothetical protein
MKSNLFARRLARVRKLTLALLIAAIVGIQFGLIALLAKRVGQTSVVENDTNQNPGVVVGDLLAAVP